MKDFHVVDEKMTRNVRKMSELIDCAFRFETEFNTRIILGKKQI